MCVLLCVCVCVCVCASCLMLTHTLQLLLSADEVRMMVALASNGGEGGIGSVTFPTFLRIAEMTQWYWPLQARANESAIVNCLMINQLINGKRSLLSVIKSRFKKELIMITQVRLSGQPTQPEFYDLVQHESLKCAVNHLLLALIKDLCRYLVLDLDKESMYKFRVAYMVLLTKK